MLYVTMLTNLTELQQDGQITAIEALDYDEEHIASNQTYGEKTKATQNVCTISTTEIIHAKDSAYISN